MQNLLAELIDILLDTNKDNINDSIDIRKATNFLLGMDNTTWDDSEYYKLKRNPQKLSLDRKSILLQKESWNLSKIISDPNSEREVEQKLSECYKRTINHDESHTDISTKIKQLVFLSIYGSIHPALFMTWNIKNSFKNCSNYISRPDVIQNIQSRLSKNNILILTGEPAIGKTQVILEYIQKCNYNEAIWFKEPPSSNESLKKQLNEAAGKENEAVGNEILIPSDVLIETALQEKSNESLIVIERTVLQKTDYDYIYDNFSGKKLHIIAATRKAPCETPDTMHLERLSSECLLEIFKGHLPNNPDFFTNEEFDSLLEIIDFNTLVVALLGKALNCLFSENEVTRKKTDIENKRANIKEKLLDSKQWIWKDTTLPPISHKNYRKESNANSIMYFIRSIIREFPISDKHKLQYAELALWVRGTLAVSALKSWCTDGISETINEAVQLGIADYTNYDKSTLEIHPFISDALWSEIIQNPRSFVGKDTSIVLLFEKNISKFLDKLRIGTTWEHSYIMLYRAANTFIEQLKMEMHPEKKRGFSIKDWRKLWEIMEHILIIFIECGNAAMAQDIIQELYFYDCSKNSDNLKGKKFDDKNETNSARLYFNKISLEWMNGQEPQSLIEQIPKKVWNIPHEYRQKEWTKILDKILDKIECGIDIKGLDNLTSYVLDDKSGNNSIYNQDNSISEMLNCFQVVLHLLIIECADDLRIKYYRGIFYYLQALYKCDSANDFLDDVNKAHSYYKQLFSYEDDMNRDFWFIVRFSHIYYECRILIKDLTIHHPSIQEIQSCFGYLCNLFESTEIEYNKSMHSEECLAVYQKANMFIMIIQAYRTGNNEILVNAVKNMRTSFFDQVHINKKMSDTIRNVYDNTEKGLKNISQ